MRLTLLILVLFPLFLVHGEERLVTLTCYWAKGSGSDRWSSKKLSASGKRLRQNVSVAVDPSVFPYGTILAIEGLGWRVAHDTGGDVIRRKASKILGVDYPVIDLFFENKSDALRFAKAQNTFTTVQVVRLGLN